MRNSKWPTAASIAIVASALAVAGCIQLVVAPMGAGAPTVATAPPHAGSITVAGTTSSLINPLLGPPCGGRFNTEEKK